MNEEMKKIWDTMDDSQRNQAREQFKDESKFQDFQKSLDTEKAQQIQDTPAQPIEQQNQPKVNDEKPNISPDFDSSRFTNEQKQIRVQEGSAKDTGRPDFQLESDERNAEIVNNLNSYYQSNPEFFKDREGFDKAFDYGKRANAQKTLLDSFRQKKELSDKVAQYNDGQSVYSALNDGSLTTAQLELMRTQRPDLYAQYMAHKKKLLNLDMVNASKPSKIAGEDEKYLENTDALKTVMGRLGFSLTADGSAMDIYGKYKEIHNREPRIETKDKYLESKRKYLAKKREYDNVGDSIRSQYAGATDSYIRSKINNSRRYIRNDMQDLLDDVQIHQEDYKLLTNDMREELDAFKAQATEEHNAFNRKLSGLGFSKGMLAFETPDQQREANLDFAEKKGRLDISLKMEAQKEQMKMMSDLSDLSVSDPAQLRANLSHTLDDYYKQFGAIIQRPKSGVVDDVLAYARKHGVSVAEALRKNFIEPLQGKPEYKMMMNRSAYGISNESKVGTSNAPKWKREEKEDGTFKLVQEGIGNLPDNLQRKQRVQEYKEYLSTANSVEEIGEYVGSMLPNGTKAGQCGAFANDIANATGQTVRFGDSVASKTNPQGDYTKSNKPVVGAYAVIPSLSAKENGHVGIITGVNEDGTFTMTSSNNKGDERIFTSTHKPSEGLAYIVPKMGSTGNTYSSLSDGDKTYVNMLANYEVEAPSKRAKNYTQLLAAAKEKNPNFDMKQYKERADFKKAWNRGTIAGGALSKVSTATQLLMELDHTYQNLKGQSRQQALNAITNKMNREFGDPNIVGFDAIRDMAVKELAGAFKGNASPSESEVKQMSDILGNKLSPAQTKEAIKQMARGSFSKISTEAGAYYNVMGDKPEGIFDNQVEDWMVGQGLLIGNYFKKSERGKSESYYENIGKNNNSEFDNGLNFILGQ